jgi:hypothetical protein
VGFRSDDVPEPSTYAVIPSVRDDAAPAKPTNRLRDLLAVHADRPR